ncbi:MAG TPA: hypothetical protein DIT58_10565, partial [Porticoccaceae bacterium]|nr:hypothetical protein [Porticoccaceae bacterium]
MPENERPNNEDLYRRATRLVLLFIGIYALAQYLNLAQPEGLSYTAFKDAVAAGKINKITVKHETITGSFTSSAGSGKG